MAKSRSWEEWVGTLIVVDPTTNQNFSAVMSSCDRQPLVTFSSDRTNRVMTHDAGQDQFPWDRSKKFIYGICSMIFAMTDTLAAAPISRARGLGGCPVSAEVVNGAPS
ncbi:MAG: hypothetical protein B7Z80_01870 [Rhodospirillales bacterium 20-64-7]|nr:MAG: hypothetical protein B7Z80_01870 [Rhodospirillales bacterium 20-64-7]